MTMPSLNFRLPQPMLDWVNRKAEESDRKPAWLVRQALLRMMNDDEVAKLDADLRQAKRVSTPAKQANPSNP